METSSTRHEQRLLGGVIRRRLEDITARWMERLRIEHDLHEVAPTDLKNSMPEYLARLADALDADDGGDEHAGSAAWLDVARRHAITRVHLGFDIAELASEFTLLRRVLFEVGR